MTEGSLGAVVSRSQDRIVVADRPTSSPSLAWLSPSELRLDLMVRPKLRSGIVYENVIGGQKVPCNRQPLARGYPLSRVSKRIRNTLEAYGRLVGPPVFKTGERQILSLAGSIPVRLRHLIGHTIHTR